MAAPGSGPSSLEIVPFVTRQQGMRCLEGASAPSNGQQANQCNRAKERESEGVKGSSTQNWAAGPDQRQSRDRDLASDSGMRQVHCEARLLTHS